MDLLDFCGISIHAPRTGSDMSPSARGCQTNVFQSTLPARGATDVSELTGGSLTFQSTLPARGATTPSAAGFSGWGYFNPRSPHGERPLPPSESAQCVSISIHAPRTGSDRQGSRSRDTARYFNPRSPHGERRDAPEKFIVEVEISIHAPRTGSDPAGAADAQRPDISIHAPRTGSDARMVTSA